MRREARPGEARAEAKVARRRVEAEATSHLRKLGLMVRE